MPGRSSLIGVSVRLEQGRGRAARDPPAAQPRLVEQLIASARSRVESTSRIPAAGSARHGAGGPGSRRARRQPQAAAEARRSPGELERPLGVEPGPGEADVELDQRLGLGPAGAQASAIGSAASSRVERDRQRDPAGDLVRPGRPSRRRRPGSGGRAAPRARGRRSPPPSTSPSSARPPRRRAAARRSRASCGSSSAGRASRPWAPAYSAARVRLRSSRSRSTTSAGVSSSVDRHGRRRRRRAAAAALTRPAQGRGRSSAAAPLLEVEHVQLRRVDRELDRAARLERDPLVDPGREPRPAVVGEQPCPRRRRSRRRSRP